MLYLMNAYEIGMRLADARRAAGLTQAALAERMGTSQSVIARAESGGATPRIDLIERIAKATGATITLGFGGAPPARAELRRRVRRALGPKPFDPRDRNPTPIEIRSLEADGL